MPKLPTTHNYSSLDSFERLLFLVAAIAHNPGIADSNSAANADKDPAEILLQSMQDLAKTKGIVLPEWSAAAIRKDLGVLKQYGILPKSPNRQGYFLGGKEKYEQPIPTPPPRNHHGNRKSHLSDQQILQMRQAGFNYETIGRAAGISRQAAAQAVERAKQTLTTPDQ